MAVASWLDTLLLLMVTAAAINDLSSRRIPNLLLLAGMSGALVLHLLSPQPLRAALHLRQARGQRRQGDAFLLHLGGSQPET